MFNFYYDIVKLVVGWIKDFFLLDMEEGMFYGLGSNDVGGFFVSLIVIFLYFYEWEGLFFNFILAVMVEEEILGVNGIVVVFLELLEIVVGIIGEFM